eukprot:scaffold116858_cov63-Phaeocystis_antarctica.AAC.3
MLDEKRARPNHDADCEQGQQVPEQRVEPEQVVPAINARHLVGVVEVVLLLAHPAQRPRVAWSAVAATRLVTTLPAAHTRAAAEVAGRGALAGVERAVRQPPHVAVEAQRLEGRVGGAGSERGAGRARRAAVHRRSDVVVVRRTVAARVCAGLGPQDAGACLTEVLISLPHASGQQGLGARLEDGARRTAAVVAVRHGHLPRWAECGDVDGRAELLGAQEYAQLPAT